MCKCSQKPKAHDSEQRLSSWKSANAPLKNEEIAALQFFVLLLTEECQLEIGLGYFQCSLLIAVIVHQSPAALYYTNEYLHNVLYLPFTQCSTTPAVICLFCSLGVLGACTVCLQNSKRTKKKNRTCRGDVLNQLQ